jgi:PAS domain S-box-containing protein
MIIESTASELRETGISVIGDVPWGTHFCYFYETKQDLLETLVPYFKAGLESKEFCVWVVPPHLSVEEAKRALEQAIPDIERHLTGGVLEIRSHHEWYLRGGRWDPRRVLQSWREKIDQGLAPSYAGLRAAGDGGWVPNDDWMAFREYEKQVNAMIAEQRSIILCTYPLTTSSGDQVFDVAHIHHLAVARRHGTWEMVETPELRKAKAEIARLNEELERKVERRTKELAQTNEALRAEIAERKLAEAAVKQADDRIRLVIDTIPTMAWSLRPDGVVDFVNQRWIDYTGISFNEALQAPNSIVYPDDLPRVLEKWVRDMSSGEPSEDELRLRRADGEYRWFLVRTVPLRDEQGEIIKWYGTSTDIEDRKQAEETVWQSLNLLRAISEGTIDAMYAKDRDGRYLMINTAGARFEGRTPEEVIGLDDTQLFSGETLERIIERDRAVLETGDTRTDEDIVTAPDGLHRVHLTTKGPLRDPAGTVVGLFGVSRDITENKRAEQALRESEQRFRELAENINEVFWLSDHQNARMHYISSAYERVWGRSCASLYAAPRSWMDAVHPEDKEQVVATVAKRSLSETYHNTYRIVRPDGSIRWIHDRGFPVRDERGVAVRFAGIAEDITEHKEADQARERVLSLMLATLESTADGILVVNTEGKIETFNRIFARMWRLPDNVLASKEDARALECVLDQLVEPEKFLENVSYLYQHPEVESFDRLVFKDGRVFERYSRPQRIGGKVAGRVWSFRDVTERGRAAKALEEANDQLRFLSRRLFQVQEDERRHLARELHDEIGQTLTAAKINLDSIDLADEQTQVPRLKETITLLDNLLLQVRQISLDLHPSLLDDLGLVPALRSLLDQQARRAGLRMQFSAPERLQPVDLGLQTTAFRIAQEAITNVLRHAGAQSVGVNLSIEAGQLLMRIVDDGKGFDLTEIERRSQPDAGFGLIGMKERAALVGGALHVISSPGKGTAIEVFLPLSRRPSDASR